VSQIVAEDIYVKNKQDRQSTYNATLGRFRATTVAMEKKKVLRILIVCVCSLWYPAHNAHAPYFHMWPPRLVSTFPHYLINGMIVTEYNKRILIFSTTFA